MQGRTPNNNRHYIRPYVAGAIIFFLVVLGVIEVFSLLEHHAHSQVVFSPSADKWIALISAILSYVGTCFIGIIAMWQNKQLSGINERLMKIEEVKLIPRFNFKPGQPTYPSPGKTTFYLILEHIGGDIAVNFRIEDLSVQVGNITFTPSAFGPLPSQFCENSSWKYRFTCDYTLGYGDEAYATFTVCFSDILGKKYVQLCEITWKSQSSFHHKEPNSTGASLAGASNSNSSSP